MRRGDLRNGPFEIVDVMRSNALAHGDTLIFRFHDLLTEVIGQYAVR